jgi:glycerophosphoryl diester phosphodiesterase
MKWPVDPESKILIIAHRGASGYAPENTLSAFKRAIEMGADMIELDIHQTKDGEIVVLHDKNLFRVAKVNKLVEDLTLKEIKELEVGSWFSPEYTGEKIPTLREVLSLVKGKVGVNIEIKKGRRLYPEIEEKLVKIIEEYDLVEPVIISSFHSSYLEKIKKLNPYIALGKLLVFSVFLPWENLVKDVNAIHPHWSMVNSYLVKSAHKDHLKVNVWTVNNTGIAARLVKLGVDGIITNYPERIAWVINLYKEKNK